MENKSSVPNETKSESSSSAMIEAIRERLAGDYHVKDMLADIKLLLTELDRLEAMIADATQIEMSLRAQLDKAGVERDMLGDAIARVAIKAEVIDGKSPLTGPQLLMLCDDVSTELDKRAEKVKRLTRLINTPHTKDFLQAVPLEAAYQVNRWGTEHDVGKEPQDFFWLLGYLAGKALTAALAGNEEKAKHHTVSSAAVLLNWHRRLSGDEASFQPGTADGVTEARRCEPLKTPPRLSKENHEELK